MSSSAAHVISKVWGNFVPSSLSFRQHYFRIDCQQRAQKPSWLLVIIGKKHLDFSLRKNEAKFGFRLRLLAKSDKKNSK